MKRSTDGLKKIVEWDIDFLRVSTNSKNSNKTRQRLINDRLLCKLKTLTGV